MGLNNEIPVSDFGYSGVAQCLRIGVTPANAGGIVVGKLPRGAMLVGGGVQVYEAFPEGTLALIGQPGDIDVLASVDLATLGFTPIDPGKFFSADEITITARIDAPVVEPPPPAAPAVETDDTTAHAYAPGDAPADQPRAADAPPQDPAEARLWAKAQLEAGGPTLLDAAIGKAFVAVLFIPPKSPE